MPRIVCISDTHGKNLNTKWEIPDGDILIHAGDLTPHGHKDSVKKSSRELLALPHKYKIFVPGNHDQDSFSFNPRLDWRWMPGIIVLQEELINVMGLWIYGCDGVTPVMELTNGAHTQYLEINDMSPFWNKIPKKTDILITHMPPRGILDVNKKGNHMGSPYLTVRVTEQIKPKLHVFGHIHASYGMQERNGTTFVNAALVDDEHKPTNVPVVINI